MMQYYIDVVPTEIRLHNFLSKSEMYQYSVKENIRIIDHGEGSHGVPGLYFKYDIAALKVEVCSQQIHILKFLTRVSSVIAGIVVIFSFVNTCLQFIYKKLREKK